MYLRRKNKVKVQNLKSEKEKIPKLIIYYFLTSQLWSGVDYGFSALLNKRNRSVVQFVTNVVSVIYIAVLLAPVKEKMHEVVFWSILFEYTICVVALKLINYKVYNLITEVNEIFVMKAEEKQNVCLMALIYTPLLIIPKLMFQIFKCHYEKSDLTKCANFNWILSIFYGFPYWSLDMIAVSQVVIVYYIYCNIRKLKEFLYAGQEINTFIKNYVAIIECFDRIKPVYNTFILLKLITGIPALLDSLVLIVVNVVKRKAHWSFYTNEVVYSAVIILHILVPSLVIEKINACVDDIRVILHEQLVMQYDVKRKTVIANVLRYITARPMQYVVCQFIPVDVNLILSVFSFCTTYFIVVIQFLKFDEA